MIGNVGGVVGVGVGVGVYSLCVGCIFQFKCVYCFPDIPRNCVVVVVVSMIDFLVCSIYGTCHRVASTPITPSIVFPFCISYLS